MQKICGAEVGELISVLEESVVQLNEKHRDGLQRGTGRGRSGEGERGVDMRNLFEFRPLRVTVLELAVVCTRLTN